MRDPSGPKAAAESKCLTANIVRGPRVILTIKVPVISSTTLEAQPTPRAGGTRELSRHRNPTVTKSGIRQMQSEWGLRGDSGRHSGGPDPRGLLTKVCQVSGGHQGPAGTHRSPSSCAHMTLTPYPHVGTTGVAHTLDSHSDIPQDQALLQVGDFMCPRPVSWESLGAGLHAAPEPHRWVSPSLKKAAHPHYHKSNYPFLSAQENSSEQSC